MSLINEVLRDLDARHAAANERAALAPQVRALPQTRNKSLKPVLLPMFAAVLGGVAVWLWVNPLAVVGETASVSAPAEAAAPIAASSVSEPLPEPEPIQLESFKLDEAMTTLSPERLAQLQPKSALKTSASPVKPEEKPSLQTQGNAVVAPSPSIAPPQSLPSRQQTDAHPQINKQPTAAGTPAEQAENEYRRGLAAARKGASVEAGDAFRAALRAQPGHVAARQALLGQLVELRQWQSVEVLALDGLGLVPSRNDWALLAARVQYDRGEFAQALETLSQYAATAKANPDYQVFHALLLQRAQRNTEAVSAYQNALAVRPGEGRWWYGLGRALDADNRDSEARQAYERARDSGNLPPDIQSAVERRLK